MVPLPNLNPFKRGQGGGGKETALPGGGPPAVNPNKPVEIDKLNVPGTAARIVQKTEAEVQSELDTLFSPYMDKLISAQDPKAPFFVKFGLNKGEKTPKSHPIPDLAMQDDTRVLLLIAPNAEGSFIAITRQGPKEIKTKTPAEAKKIQDVIDRCLGNKKGEFGGGFYPTERGEKNQIVIGYNFDKQTFSRIDIDPTLLSTPSPQEVLERIQASMELALAREEEKQKPLRETQEQLQKNREIVDILSNSLKEPFTPRLKTPPPSSPTT